MYILAYILLFLVALGSTMEHKGEMIHCESREVTCVCGIGENRTYARVMMETFAIEDSTTGKLECDGLQDPYQACANISCFLAKSVVNLPLETNDIIPKLFHKWFIIPPGGYPEGHRSRRHTGPCHVPTLKNAEIKCWKWPNWMNCDINCIPGYALQEAKGTVTTKNVNCRNTENVWKPQDFKDCQPFLNCNVELTMPGNLKCVEPIHAPAYCDISCLDYGEFEATGLRKYECLDETFGRTLPHCASLKKKASLIPKPK